MKSLKSVLTNYVYIFGVNYW